MLLRHCSAAFMKHVLPRLESPSKKEKKKGKEGRQRSLYDGGGGEGVSSILVGTSGVHD